MVELAEPGREARPWRRIAGAETDAGNRRHPRRAAGRIAFRRPAFGLLDAGRTRALRDEDARTLRRQALPASSLHRQPDGIPGDRQGHARDGEHPDFIVVDGKEGGTGAAPLEFMDHLGMPMRDGLNFVHNALVGANLRRRIQDRRRRQDRQPSTSPAPSRSAPTGAIPRAASCSPSAASSRRPATPTNARQASRRRTRRRGARLVVADKTTRRQFPSGDADTLAELDAAAGLEHPQDFHGRHFARHLSRRRAASRTLSGADAGRTGRRHGRSALPQCVAEMAARHVPAGLEFNRPYISKRIKPPPTFDRPGDFLARGRRQANSIFGNADALHEVDELHPPRTRSRRRPASAFGDLAAAARPPAAPGRTAGPPRRTRARSPGISPPRRWCAPARHGGRIEHQRHQGSRPCAGTSPTGPSWSSWRELLGLGATILQDQRRETAHPWRGSRRRSCPSRRRRRGRCRSSTRRRTHRPETLARRR